MFLPRIRCHASRGSSESEAVLHLEEPMAFDWPDRPKTSPTGSALIQSRSGRHGNFEVVIPWPNGGLAHFWRNNDEQPAFPWHGPNFFGQGKYLGASLTEGFNKFTSNVEMGNFEVLAVRDT